MGNNGQNEDRSNWTDWAVLAIGLGLLVSPFALGFSDDATAEWVNISAGMLLIAIAMLRLLAPTTSGQV